MVTRVAAADEPLSSPEVGRPKARHVFAHLRWGFGTRLRPAFSTSSSLTISARKCRGSMLPSGRRLSTGRSMAKQFVEASTASNRDAATLATRAFTHLFDGTLRTNLEDCDAQRCDAPAFADSRIATSGPVLTPDAPARVVRFRLGRSDPVLPEACVALPVLG